MRPGSAVIGAILFLWTWSAPAEAGNTPPQRSTQRMRLASLRIAASIERVDDAFALRQIRDGFNAITLDASTSYNPETGAWTEITEGEIVRQLDVARRHGLAVILHVPALVVIDNRSGKAVALPELRADHSVRARGRVSALGIPDFTLIPRPLEEFRASLARWYRHDRGELLGTYFTGEDIFLLEVPRAWQRAWRDISHELKPSILVFGMIGEFSLVRPSEVTEKIWDPKAFDHLIVLNYPYDLGWWWTDNLNHTLAEDPDAALYAYEERYFAALHARYLHALDRSQLLLFVHQAFVYPGAAPGSTPRPQDLEIQVDASLRELARRGQAQNHAVGWFYTGRVGIATTAPWGIYDHPVWPMVIRSIHDRLADRDPPPPEDAPTRYRDFE